MRQVPIIRIPFSEEDVQTIQDDIGQVLNSGMLTLGAYTRRFEKQFKEFTGAEHVLAVSNGTSALEVIIRGLGIEGKSIIVPTNTFLASALAVAHAGNRVIFADSDPETFSLNPADVERRIEADTAAVMVVHIGGIISPDMDTIIDLCSKKGLFLIEDCAHAHGSTIRGTHAGLLGDAGAFSFFPTKTLTTGEGGMVITNNAALYEKASMLRNQGKNPTMGGKISEFGHNWRISELTAALGVQQMKRAPTILADRGRIAAFYNDALQEIQGVRAVRPPAGTTTSHYKYIVYLDPEFDRAQVKQVMKDTYGVSLTGEVYADLCHQEPVWENYTYCGKQRSGQPDCTKWPECGCGDVTQEFPGADYVSKHHICLPMYPGLEEEDLQHVIDSLDRTLQVDLRQA